MAPFLANSKPAGPRFAVLLGCFCACGVVLFGSADALPEAVSNSQQIYATTRSNYVANPGEVEPAWRFARACFDLAEYATNNQHRAFLADEGIKAARLASQVDSNSSHAHFYLALNLGQLARTKSLGALSIVRQMESAFLRAIELDPHVAHAGPDRSLGLLYLEAPGWPTSIGSKRKAREHLQRAVQIEPDYPDNHLTLLEAYVRWNETSLLRKGVERYRRLLSEARQKYSGKEWEQSWRDWEQRWNAVQQQASGG